MFDNGHVFFSFSLGIEIVDLEIYVIHSKSLNNILSLYTTSIKHNFSTQFIFAKN